MCPTVRENAPVVIAGISTGDYPMEARVHLGTEVKNARLAAGIRSRAALAKLAGVSTKAIGNLEAPRKSPPTGYAVLAAVARVLPNWTEETPRRILEGGKAPAPDQPEPTSIGPAAIYDFLAEVGWSNEEEEEFQMYKLMLAKGGLKLTVRRYIEMRHDFDLDDNNRQPTPDDGK